MMGKLSQKRTPWRISFTAMAAKSKLTILEIAVTPFLPRKPTTRLHCLKRSQVYHQIDNKGSYDDDNKILVNKQQKSSKHCRPGD